MPARCPRILAALLALFLLLVHPSLALGQKEGGGVVPNIACPPEGCILGVSVTPDGDPESRLPNTGPFVASFEVQNTGNSAASFTFTCSKTGGITCGTVTPTSASIATGAVREVLVQYSISSTAGQVILTATGGATDQGYYIVAFPGPPAAMALRNHNGDHVNRSGCLVAGAGEAAAWECGDLVVTHSLPGYSTLGRERSLTLLYNSAQAVPKPVVAVAVTEASTVAKPDTIYVELQINGVKRDSAKYVGWNTAPNTRQIVVAHDATTDADSLYAFTLLVQNRYTVGGSYGTTVSDTMIVVNRSQSRFGKGWSLAGVEGLRLNQPGGRILWVGGDGSAKVYRGAGSNKWVAAAGAYRDTLGYNPTNLTYTRTLRHGVKVTYNQQGRHLATTNRVGQQTSFVWNLDTLKSITVPPAGQPGTTYNLTYDANSNLDKITDPAGRVLDATVASATRQLLSLRDPDTVTTQFAYADPAGRLSGRTNRRRFTTSYQYGNGLRVTSVTIPTGQLPSDPNTAVTVFQPWDEKGLAVAPSGQTAVDTAQVFTKILGPRANVADDAQFWIDRWGAPTKTVDPIGATTTLVRGDAGVPALVTQVKYPDSTGAANGRVVKLSYNARGNLTQTRDSTKHLDAQPTRVTAYVYSSPNTADSPSQVNDSISAQARITRYVYTSLGLTDTVIDPRGHKTSFGYATGTLVGLVNRVTEHNVETWLETAGVNDTAFTLQNQTTTFGFDAWGNLRADTSAAGVVTSYVRDTVQRVAEVHDPLGTKIQRLYDAMNRVTQTVQYTAPQTNPYGINPLLTPRCRIDQVVCADSTRAFAPTLPATLSATYAFGALTLDSVMDPRLVKRSYTYDARGLATSETDDYGASRNVFYNAAGLLDSVRLRNGAVVRYSYDAAGRRTMMWFPSRQYNLPPSCNFSCSPSAYLIPGDSITYTHDEVGNLLTTASRNRGSIIRTYYANGLLKSKTATLVFNDVISYAYDQAGALTRAIHGTDTTDYSYIAATGDLQTLTARLGGSGTAAARTRTFSFVWDSLGRRRQITYPGTANGPMVVKYRYDAAGILRRVVSTNPTTPADNFDFILRNPTVDPAGRILAQYLRCFGGPVGNDPAYGNPCGRVGSDATQLDTRNTYNRAGALIWQSRNGVVDSMAYDASQNMIYRKSGDEGLTHLFAIRQWHDRLVRDSMVGSADTLGIDYDVDGNRGSEWPKNQASTAERHFYYDALGRLSGTWAYVGPVLRDRPNDCLYDAEGQLARGCDNAPGLTFDGSNVSGSPMSGGNGWTFFHAPGLDDPLMGYNRQATYSRLLYFVTDGGGRQLAVSDSSGVQLSTDASGSPGSDWRYAGGISNSYTFNGDRFENSNTPGLSFFRNRAYDQNTGRWLQEDPIGIAGGLNLYQFNGNNPVTFTDPFGLCFGPLAVACAYVAELLTGVALDEVVVAGAVAITAGIGTYDVIRNTGFAPDATSVGGQATRKVASDPLQMGERVDEAHRKVTPSKREKHEKAKRRPQRLKEKKRGHKDWKHKGSLPLDEDSDDSD